MWNQELNARSMPPLLTWQELRIVPGLNAVAGDEGTGKTRLLQDLAQAVPDAIWLDLRMPGHDSFTALEVWREIADRRTHWNEPLAQDLARALSLEEHLHKQLFMLSTGSRRKVGLVGLLASGATITCLDQPYVSLDMASVEVLREFLQDMADDTSRAWVVADYEADPSLPWRSVVTLPAR